MKQQQRGMSSRQMKRKTGLDPKDFYAFTDNISKELDASDFKQIRSFMKEASKLSQDELIGRIQQEMEGLKKELSKKPPTSNPSMKVNIQ
ncbi:hypothetical protein IMZ31_20525 (plasmid) [Pontibacillus sp. ALD_SL1]|uniref:hypothetical protein n=1 Tax=Pontibacillus sp. ALD_SL1 TaxID=2777185 RepID=UPI001A97B1FB|nr:hypothetical protein [Pontibacillus sp. ALD_SL1]QST02936.1 hypothetical protein IMZ31_20525 [Pontibacillus sp. ALD_SL1]